MMFTVKFQGMKVGMTSLEKGDPPMGVALGMMEPICVVEDALGKPLNSEKGIKGWEGLEVYITDDQKLECQSAYLEQFDFEKGKLVYQISCLGIYRPLYEVLFPHHIETYDSSFT